MKTETLCIRHVLIPWESLHYFKNIELFTKYHGSVRAEIYCSKYEVICQPTELSS